MYEYTLTDDDPASAQVASVLRHLLAPLSTWADALRAGRRVEVPLAESVTISVGRAEVHLACHQQAGRLDDDAVAALLAVLLLRDLIGGPGDQGEPGGQARIPRAHPAGPHQVALDCPLRCLGLSPRAYRPLMLDLCDREPVTVRDLVASDEDNLREIRNLGRGRIAEIKSKLAQAGFRLGGVDTAR